MSSFFGLPHTFFKLQSSLLFLCVLFNGIVYFLHSRRRFLFSSLFVHSPPFCCFLPLRTLPRVRYCLRMDIVPCVCFTTLTPRVAFVPSFFFLSYATLASSFTPQEVSALPGGIQSLFLPAVVRNMVFSFFPASPL